MSPNTFLNEDEIVEPILSTIEKVLQKKECVKLCLSGGTSILKTLELFSEKNIPWEKIVIYQTDERVVSLDSEDSNFYWIKKILGNTGATLRPFYNGYTEQESKQFYDQYLNLYCKNEDCTFDLLLLGFGEDGHIASLFPGKEHLEGEDKVLYIAERLNGYQRLSLSLSQLKRSSSTFIISYGETKHHTLKGSSHLNLPIHQFLKDQVNVTWYHKE